jgi:chromosome segregation ATPase
VVDLFQISCLRPFLTQGAIEEKEHHIAALEMQIAELKTEIEKSFEKNGNQSDILSDDKQTWEKIKNFLDEFEKVRPAEKKLILKIAGEVKALRNYLESLGMKTPENI